MFEGMGFWQVVGTFASTTMPLWNIPLIIRIYKRKSSGDISVPWVLGVMSCILLMTPSGLMSEEIVLKGFVISNLFLFSVVTFVVVYYRNGPKVSKVVHNE